MNKQNPLISICIPAYNCERYLPDTLAAICSQTYVNIEIIVVNDGSTDRTAAFLDTLRDPRLKVIHVVNGGAARARNIAYNSSSGDYIIFFDADDLVGPDFISLQLEAAGSMSAPLVMAAWGRFYQDTTTDFKLNEEPEGRPQNMEEWITTHWLNGRHNTPPGRLLIPRYLLEKAGLWNEQLTLNDDFEFFTRIALHAELIVPNPPAVYHYRSGIGGLSSQKGEKAFLSLFNSIKLSADRVLQQYPGNSLVKKACANLWQGFIFEVYPLLKEKRIFAEEQILGLGESGMKYQSGGLTRILVSLLGWKTTKQLKRIFNK